MASSTILDIFTQKGFHVESGSNHPVLLNDPGYVYMVISGKIDIFSVGTDGNKPVGNRFYFFTVNKGDLLFGLNSNQYGNGRALLGVGSAETALRRLSLGDFIKLSNNDLYRKEVCNLTDTWLHGISFGISKDINPETDLLVEQGLTIDIESNKKIRSKKEICWIRPVTGNALFLGIKEITNQDFPLFFPLSKDSWVQSLEKSDYKTLSTSKFIDSPVFWQSLEYFYEVIFFCELLNTRLIMVDELNRLTEKADELKKKKQDAFLKIASVINKSISKSYIRGDDSALVAACRYVADFAGISIKLPKGSGTLETREIELKDIIRSSRFRVRKVELSDNWWRSDCGPLLAFTKDNNLPVALIPRPNNQYDIIDPTEATKKRATKEFSESINRTVYQFYRPFPDKVITGRDLLRFGLKGTKRDFLRILAVGIAGGLLALLIPILTGVIFDKVIPQSDYRELYVFAAAIFVSAFAIAIFQLVRSFTMIRIETKVDFQLQAALWDRILGMPVPFFKNYSSGELASKANSLTVLRKMLSSTVIYALVSSIFAIFNYFILFFYDPLLALLTTLILLFSLALFGYWGLKIQQSQRTIIEMQNKISGLLFQFLNSISKLKIAGAEIPAFSLWAEKFAADKKATLKVRTYSNLVRIFISVLPVIATLILFGTIAYDNTRTLSTGEFLAFFTAFTLTISVVLQLGNSGITFFSSLPLFENIKPILETLPENDSAKHDIQPLRGEIEVNDINFRYDPEGPMVLTNISMHILPGEYVAIVGPSGSGKSTLLRLLLGFETPLSGSVYYDRQDLAMHDPSSVRRQIGTVLQESRLASGNILSNIISISDKTIDDAWDAAKKVGLDNDIRSMPMGMFTIITDGLSTLSGGQRQRIMIARAIVSKPRILFLDEATSALDNETQRVVSESLDKIQSTRFVIAHRLSTIKNANKIFVMENGRIVEVGSYDELMNIDKKFAALVKRQLID